MGARIFIVLRDGEAKLLTLQLAKEGDAALARNPGLRKEYGASLISTAFLIACEGEKLALCRCGAQSQNRHAGFARTCSHCQRRPHQRQQRNLAGRPGTFAKAHIVASRNMAQLVRDHALQLVHVVGRCNQAAVDEHILPTRHKGVDGRITHQHELHAARIKPRCIDQRPRNLAEKRLRFGVAQDGLRPGRAGKERQGQRQQRNKDAHASSPCLA